MCVCVCVCITCVCVCVLRVCVCVLRVCVCVCVLALNPFEEQENVDARFVEETALKQTLIELRLEDKT